MRVFALPCVALLAIVGCTVPATDEDTSGSGDAISHRQAADQFEFAEVVVDAAKPSDDVRALGVASWTVYSASKQGFLGLVMFATDSSGDVKYMILANARRAADGKVTVAAFELDKEGRKTNVEAATLKTLTSDMGWLRGQAELAAAAPESRAMKCAVALAKLTLGALAGVALVMVAIPAIEVGAAFWAGLSILGRVGVVAGSLPISIVVWTPPILSADAASSALTHCPADER